MSIQTERPAESGEFCTCGRQAVTVFEGSVWGPTGYCGLDVGPVTPCPWCGNPRGHTGRCPDYRLTGWVAADRGAAGNS